MWQALDHVIAEAREQGIWLLLSLVNNLQAFGGKTQYVKWAWQEGIGLSSSNDSFYFDPSIRKYFKSYVKVPDHRLSWLTLFLYFIQSILLWRVNLLLYEARGYWFHMILLPIRRLLMCCGFDWRNRNSIPAINLWGLISWTNIWNWSSFSC